MKAFFCPDQLLHDPQQYMRVGVIRKPMDLPERAHALMRAVRAAGGEVHTPPELGSAALHAVHAPYYIDFLEQAWTLWQSLAGGALEPGIEVLPNLSPYYSAIPGVRRGPCPSAAVLAQVGYYLGDLSCPMGPNSWRAIMRSAHTAMAAAQTVCDGAPRAYALCRPSGHHAHIDRASGFCFVNNSALAAQTLRSRFERVAVLDVDAHHGDGTQNIFYDRADVLTISLHASTDHYYPFYSGYAHERGVGAGEGFNLNLPLAHGSDQGPFEAALQQAVQAIENYAPGALVLAMGFDTHKDDPISVLRLDHPAYHHIGRTVAALGLPLVVVQEGGYLIDALEPGLGALLEGLS